jgi:hypothetical protein
MKERPSLGIAIVLIAVGSFFLLRELGAFGDRALDFEELWPGILVLVGAAFLLQFFLGGTRDPGFAFVGTAALLLGFFFFLFTLNVELPFRVDEIPGPIDWDDMEYLWPVFPIIGGIALVAMSILSRETEAFWVGAVAIIVGGVALAFTLGLADGTAELVKYWPLLLILLGGGMLLRQLFGHRQA